MESLDMKEYCSQVQLHVNVIGSLMVPPSRPSPKTILYLSNLDDHLVVRRRFDTLLLYNNGSLKVPNPVKVIRDALSHALTYYYPLAGRVKRTQDGRKLQVECTGEGALFVEAATDNTLSQLGDLGALKHSLDHLLHQLEEVEEVPPLIFQVTRFSFGGLVVGVSFNHSLCDGYLRSGISFLEMKRSCEEIVDVRICGEDATYLSDWRWLGFNEVDVGWGEPIIAWPGTRLKVVFCPVIFLRFGLVVVVKGLSSWCLCIAQLCVTHDPNVT